MGPWTVHGCTVHRRPVKSCGYCSCIVHKQCCLLGERHEKKKKEWKRRKLKTQQTQRGSKLSINLKSLEAIWYHNLNNNFQFLNNIICIFIHFFIYMYFKKIQIILLNLFYETDLNKIHSVRLVWIIWHVIHVNFILKVYSKLKLNDRIHISTFTPN